MDSFPSAADVLRGMVFWIRNRALAVMNLREAAQLIDDYAAHAADPGQPAGMVAVPIHLLQKLRKALKENE